MTCVASQEQTIDLIFKRLDDLKGILTGNDISFVNQVKSLFKEAVAEIRGEGLSTKTCQEMSVKLLRKEADLKTEVLQLLQNVYALDFRDGVKSIHQSMALLAGLVSEGNKDWP